MIDICTYCGRKGEVWVVQIERVIVWLCEECYLKYEKKMGEHKKRIK